MSKNEFKRIITNEIRKSIMAQMRNSAKIELLQMNQGEKLTMKY